MRIMPVIHVESFEQADLNVGIAFDGGAYGVWLINHGVPNEKLFDISSEIRHKHSGRWIGANFLGLNNADALRWSIKAGLNGTWADNYYPDKESAEESYEVLSEESPNGFSYFGGVSFKYQRPRFADLAEDAIASMMYVDVVTTSGNATGNSPAVNKIRTMKEAIGPNKPLAIASGITPENVLDYMGYADYILVATGIGKNFSEIDPDKLNKLMDNVREK
jgi:uncharacterized protein